MVEMNLAVIFMAIKKMVHYALRVSCHEYSILKTKISTGPTKTPEETLMGAI